MARYLVGIDLGTTHTVAAYADLSAPGNPQLFEIEQLIAPGEVAARPLLPSVRYHYAPGELAEHDVALPWRSSDLSSTPGVIGELARDLGARVPGRLVTSAKSWLSHRGVDRTQPILPWGAPDEIAKISPVDASASYLAHLRDAWNWRFPNDPLHEQEIVLTIPASFDEGARALTIEAAKLAGLSKARLIEEPQAAYYDWISRNTDNAQSLLKGVRLILVCDVGGGTADFTLIKAESNSGTPKFERIAVGDHLMLGGDNMDLALAHLAEARIMASGAKLGPSSLSMLVQQCRLAKERLLSLNAPEKTTVTVVGAGSKLIGGARSAELTKKEVQEMLVEGFFPRISSEDRPQKMRGGIVEFGLPYAADPAITRHIAAFLAGNSRAALQALGQEHSEKQFPVPEAILFNGGVFRSKILSDRLLETMQSWGGVVVRQLENDSPDLAVARGAVAYGLSRRGIGVKIGAGAARSYFLLLDSSEKEKNGICVLPRGSQEGKEIQLSDRVFSLRLGQPVQFHLAYNSGDKEFKPGEIAEIKEESFSMLPPAAAELPKEFGQEEQKVRLAAALTEIGTLQMRCIAEGRDKKWRLEFQLRTSGRTALGMSGSLPLRFEEAAELVDRIFGARRQQVDSKEVRNLRRNLETILGERDDWPTAALRELFGILWESAKRRRRSIDHERIWFNLVGFCLRPGYGYPLDDWRMQQLWQIYSQGAQYKEPQVWSEWWTLWRRVAGGLDRIAQETLLMDVIDDFAPSEKSSGRSKIQKNPSYDMEVRLVGGLERIGFQRKIDIGEHLLERLKTPSIQTWWAIGRLGARIPFYGLATNVIPKEIAEKWLDRALKVDWRTVETAAFAAMLLARKTGDRDRDINEELRARVAERLRSAGAPPAWMQMVEEVSELGEADERQSFGESLPPGLRLIH